jgi:uncharacterized protein YjbJ (UPF0337 family)
MTDKSIDKTKGRVKEAAGALTGDRRLKNEGRRDQAKSSVKNAVDKVADIFGGRRKTRSGGRHCVSSVAEWVAVARGDWARYAAEASRQLQPA